MGFLFAVVISYVFTDFIATFIAHILSTGIGTNLFLVSLTKDIQRILIQINESGKTTSQRSQTMKHISEYVQFHSNAKELSCLILYHVKSFLTEFSIPADWLDIL